MVLLTAGRGVAQWLGIGGKLMQYLEYYRTALGGGTPICCVPCAFFFAFQKLHLGSCKPLNVLASATLGVLLYPPDPGGYGAALDRSSSIRLTIAGSAVYAVFVILAVYAGCTVIHLLRQRLVMRHLENSRWFAALCPKRGTKA